MDYIKAFLVGGIICVIGQVLIDKTKLTSARILVLFVVLGCILGGIGIYPKIVDFAGAGATIPLLGFGNNLAKGVINEVNNVGFIGIFSFGKAPVNLRTFPLSRPRAGEGFAFAISSIISESRQ